MTAAMATTTSATKVACVAPALVSVTAVPGSSTGYWATPQPQDDRGDAERGDDPDSLRPADGEQGEDRQAADPGQHHQRQRPAGEPPYRAGFELCSSTRAASDSAPAATAAAWARRVK